MNNITINKIEVSELHRMNGKEELIITSAGFGGIRLPDCVPTSLAGLLKFKLN